MLRSAPLIFAVAATLAACSSKHDASDAGTPDTATTDGSTPDGSTPDAGVAPPSTPATALQLCTAVKSGRANQAAIAKAKSAFAVFCAVDTPLTFLDDNDEGRAQFAALQASCKPGDADFDAFDGSIKSGDVAFDLTRLQACVAAGTAARHGAFADVTGGTMLAAVASGSACASIPYALVHEGASCAIDWDCPDGTFCEAADPTVQSLTCLKPGAIGALCASRRCDAAQGGCNRVVCQKWLELGEKCFGAPVVCAPGTRCNTTSNQCVPYDREGQPCVDGSCAPGFDCNGGTCAKRQPLVEGAACDNNTRRCPTCLSCRPLLAAADPPVCAQRGKAGDPCKGTCATGFYCDQANVSSVGTCKARVPFGSLCQERNSDQCAAGLACAGVCVNARHVGDACDPSNDTCVDGTSCQKGTCNKGGLGVPCSATSPCTGGRVCDAATQVCQNPPLGSVPVGQACTIQDLGAIPSQCVTGAICGGLNKCIAKFALGAQCVGNGTCLSNNCTSDTQRCVAGRWSDDVDARLMLAATASLGQLSP